LANSIGRLVVELAASTAKFQSDLGKAAREAEIASKRIGVAFNFAKGVIAGAVGAFSIAGFANLVKGSIDAADHLNDLSQSTGVAVETLSGLDLAAQQSGTSLDSVAKAFGKLNVQIAAGASGNEEALRTFKALGLSMADLGRLTPEEVFSRVADKFEGWTDGANKAAIGNKLFGRAYQEIIPLLNQGGDALRKSTEYALKYGAVTTDVARQADEFNDTVAKLKFQSAAFGRTLAVELLPALQALSNEFLESQENGNEFKAFASDVAGIIKGIATAAIAAVTEISALGNALGAIAAEAAAIATLDFARAREIERLATQDQDARFARSKKLIDAINNPPAAIIRPPKKRGEGKLDAPGLGSVDTEDTAKRILDGQIKALERSIKEEEEQLKDRESFLQRYYQDGYLSTKDYYDRRQQVLADALVKELETYDKEIAALQAFAAKASPKDRVDAENKIAEAIDKRAAVQKRAAVASAGLFLDEAKAAERFKDAIEDIAIELAGMQGNSTDAILAQFDKAHAALQSEIDLKRQSYDEEERRIAEIGQQKLDALRKEVSTRAQLTEATRNFSITLDQVNNAQARIDIARRSGSLTELEALQQTSDASRARIADLTREMEAAQRLAETLKSPEALQAVDNLRLKIEELAAVGDLVAKKFNDVFADSLSDALTDFATGAKSFKDILKDLEKSLVSGISRIASQNIAETLFKPDGALGGIGGFFSKIFGGKGGDAAKGAIDGAPLQAAGATLSTAGGTLTSAGGTLTGASASLTTSGTLLTTAGTTLTTAGASLTAAAASLAASAGASAASGLGSLFGGGGFSSGAGADATMSFFGFAGGGSPPVGRISIVGERGPELFVPKQSGVVIPNDVLTAKREQRTLNQTVNINVTGSVTSKTTDQLAVEIGRQTRRAMARNG
jgi:hypothetical protein